MRAFRDGFTLVELLVVIAIICVLMAILFPLLGIARGKVTETKCVSNQHQIAQATIIWAQDNKQTFPSAASFWQSINLSQQVYRCPALNAAYGYVYSSFVAGKPTAAFRENDTFAMLTADGSHEATPPVNGDPTTETFDGVAYDSTDLAFRHTGNIVVSFIDGHAISTNDPRDLPIEFRMAPATEFDGSDIVTKGNWWTSTPQLRNIKLADGTMGSVAAQFLYGTQGYVLCNWDNSGNGVINLSGANSAAPATWRA